MINAVTSGSMYLTPLKIARDIIYLFIMLFPFKVRVRQ